MNSIEVLVALLALLTFSAFALSSESKFSELISRAHTILQAQKETTKCDALTNHFYVNYGNELNIQLDCKETRAAIYEKSILASNSIQIETGAHYG